ncbi:MAG: hypothetical protein DMG51_09065 [Acidobacteria bacterium]|nr:MAG: hypothetical protein DMG51_09065 [Acidobacteriota bacterium]
MNLQLLKARQTKYVGYATLYILVVVAIVGTVNVLANRYDKTYDATSNKRYSLSEQTAKIVKGLKEDAKITYFDQGTRFERAKDQLDLYAKLSRRVHVDFIDVDKKPQLAREAGIKSYGTTMVEIGAKRQEAKGTSEEDITGALIRALKNNARTVCFVSGSGEHQIDDTDRSGYSRLRDLLVKEEYNSKSISLLQKAEVPSECMVLVVAGPTGDYQQPAVAAVKKYVEEGGRALLLLDPPLKMGRSEIADNDALAGLLQSWGITLDKDLILDLNPIGQLAGLGPQVALVTHYERHAIVNELKGSATGFPLVRSLDVKSTDKTTVEKLFGSSESSLATSKLNSPEVDPNDPKNKKGPLTIAASGSYRTGRENSEGRFVVVGSSAWAANSFISFNGNRDLAMNVMNWLASDEDLISIRPKDHDDRRITMTRGQLNWVGITSLGLLPLGIVITGVSVWWRRR